MKFQANLGALTKLDSLYLELGNGIDTQHVLLGAKMLHSSEIKGQTLFLCKEHDI